MRIAAKRRGRTRTSHACIHTGDVRALLRALARNAVVWYAPDQAARGTHTLLVPFFGEPAMTLSATSRIARMSGTAVVPVSYCRRPDDSGYDIEFFPALEDFPTDDIEADTRRLVGILEGFIRACPEQYLWSHKKFRYRPAPWPDPYRRRSPSRESSGA
jgi:KDO2-lipid IV(A) lauroyltransferase